MTNSTEAPERIFADTRAYTNGRWIDYNSTTTSPRPEYLIEYIRADLAVDPRGYMKRADEYQAQNANLTRRMAELEGTLAVAEDLARDMSTEEIDMTKKGGTYKGATAPKREECPRCVKKGLGPWKHGGIGFFQVRECRYCGHSERREIPGGEIN